LTGQVTLNLYREAVSLRFQNGKITRIVSRGLIGETACMIPPFAAVQLFFGHRSLQELEGIYPDVWVKGGEREIIELLFPKVNAFLHTNY